MDIRKIPGIGPKTEKRFKALGANTVADMRKFSEADLYGMMGEFGLDLYDKIWAKDDSELVTEWVPKSVGEQVTFEEDTLDAKIIIAELQQMAESIFKSMREEEFNKFGRIVLTVRFEDFKTVSRSKTVKGDNANIIKTEMLKMILPFFDSRENKKNQKLRLVGLRLEVLE
jgi:nucleotidyltransferase/DNA polymerase involved in DNA repair